MSSRVVTTIGVIVVIVVGCSIALGLTAPDGSVRGTTAPNVVTSRSTPPPTTPTTATPTPEPEPTEPSIDRAPMAVAEPWAGRPAAATLSGDDVDWCDAVKISGSAPGFSKEQTRAGACAAVSFVFGERYSDRSLPKKSYSASDFDSALDAFAASTASTVYRPRIAAFVASPTSTNGENLGLILLRGQPAAPYRYYDSYEERSVWINPTWSTVSVSVDHSKASPRLVTRFTASAAVPVYDTARGRDAMMTIPTTATFALRHEGSAWKIGSFSIHTGTATYGGLDLR